MPDNKQKQLVSRCPLCFGSGVDVYLVKNAENYRCLRCSFTGTEKDVLVMYDDFRKRYRWLGQRVTLGEQRDL